MRLVPAAAQGAIELFDRKQFGLPQLRQCKFTLKLIALRIEHPKITVETALVAELRQSARLIEHIDKQLLLL